jgi:hypothetical protein
MVSVSRRQELISFLSPDSGGWECGRGYVASHTNYYSTAPHAHERCFITPQLVKSPHIHGSIGPQETKLIPDCLSPGRSPTCLSIQFYLPRENASPIGTRPKFEDQDHENKSSARSYSSVHSKMADDLKASSILTHPFVSFVMQEYICRTISADRKNWLPPHFHLGSPAIIEIDIDTCVPSTIFQRLS